MRMLCERALYAADANAVGYTHDTALVYANLHADRRAYRDSINSADVSTFPGSDGDTIVYANFVADSAAHVNALYQANFSTDRCADRCSVISADGDAFLGTDGDADSHAFSMADGRTDECADGPTDIASDGSPDVPTNPTAISGGVYECLRRGCGNVRGRSRRQLLRKRRHMRGGSRHVRGGRLRNRMRLLLQLSLAAADDGSVLERADDGSSFVSRRVLFVERVVHRRRRRVSCGGLW